jgi:hypothetical protein
LWLKGYIHRVTAVIEFNRITNGLRSIFFGVFIILLWQQTIS